MVVFKWKGRKARYKKAVKWFKLAAEQGDAASQHNLGYLYENGFGVEQDYKKAVKWSKLAAEQGHAPSQGYLGYFYENGFGVEQDYEKAAEWYRLAAEQDDAGGQYFLGRLYQDGLGVKQDYNEAAKLYELAAEQDHTYAQRRLGLLYEIGQGVEQDYQKAATLYKIAVDKNCHTAQYNLAWLYQKGLGVKQNHKKAKKLFSKAAQGLKSSVKNQDPVELLYLGHLYQLGLGIEKDYAKALRLYKLAYDQGNVEAKQRINTLRVDFIPIVNSLIQENDFMQALQIANNVLEIDSNSIPFLILQSKLLIIDGSYKAAKQSLQSALKLNEDSKEKQANQAEIHKLLAIIDLNKGKINTAKQNINSYLAINSSDLEALILKCTTLSLGNNNIDVQKCFQDVLKHEPEQNLALLGLAHTLFIQCKYKEAKNTLQKIQSLDIKDDSIGMDNLLSSECLKPFLRTAALLGKSISDGPLNNQKQIKKIKNLSLGYLANQQSFIINGRQQIVFNDEGLLYDPNNYEVFYPYPGITLDTEEVTEGNTIDLEADYVTRGNLVDINLVMFTDFEPHQVLLNGAELKLDYMHKQGTVFKPTLLVKYKLSFTIPQRRMNKRINLNISSNDSRSHIYALKIQNGQVTIKNIRKSLIDEL